MSFMWTPGSAPPSIEEHSKAKLDVLRSYIRAYFDRLAVNKSRDEFRLDLVDGFCGGGVFTRANEVVSGSPLVMLEEAEAAKERLNLGRRKPLRFNCKFHFVDINPDHTENLRLVIGDRGFIVDGDQIVIHTSPFSEVVDAIIDDILRRQPRAGRSIFLLDQTGFSQVELALVAKIFHRLPGAEVILTFAAEVLVNLLDDNPQLVKAAVPLDLSENDIRNLIRTKEESGRGAVQRALRDHVRRFTQASFDTPFFIRPDVSRRALWFVHLSRHPTARDVMINCHWDNSNKFEHYGSGGFDMLGWDALIGGGTIPLFNFGELDAAELRRQLLESMPPELYSLITDAPVTVDAMHHMFANRTAGRFSDLDNVVLQLAREGEFEILSANNRPRSKRLSRLNPTDRISRPQRQMFPGWSRLLRR